MKNRIVIPHGDWDYRMFHTGDLMLRRKGIYDRKFRPSITLEDDKETPVTHEDDSQSPFRRTGIPFGGFWNDIRRRYPAYWSDIEDALNMQCFAATIFLYFACIAGGIAFGEVLGEADLLFQLDSNEIPY